MLAAKYYALAVQLARTPRVVTLAWQTGGTAAVAALTFGLVVLSGHGRDPEPMLVQNFAPQLDHPNGSRSPPTMRNREQAKQSDFAAALRPAIKTPLGPGDTPPMKITERRY